MGDPYSDDSFKQINDLIDKIYKAQDDLGKPVVTVDPNNARANIPAAQPWGSVDIHPDGSVTFNGCEVTGLGSWPITYDPSDAATDAADNRANGGNSSEFWHESSNSSQFEPLKAQCYYCEKDIFPTHLYLFDTHKYDINLWCPTCDRRENIQLTEKEISTVNAQGCWQAFIK